MEIVDWEKEVSYLIKYSGWGKNSDSQQTSTIILTFTRSTEKYLGYSKSKSVKENRAKSFW